MRDGEPIDRALRLGVLTRRLYDFEGAERLMAAKARPRTEFHALVAGGFKILDMSGGRAEPEPWWRLVSNLPRGSRLRRAVDACDAVLAMGEQLGVPAALLLASHGSRVPLYCVFHGTFLDNPRFRFAMGLVRGMQHVRFLCLSKAVQDLLVEAWRIPRHRTQVVGVGVDTDFFRPVPLSGSGVVASAGAAFRDYGTLLAAVDGLDVPVEIEAKSVFSGALDTRGVVVPKNVRVTSLPMFVGLRQLYARARIVALPLEPVRWAGGYTVAAEAMAMAKPIVTTEFPGRSDLVLPGETGIVVPPRNPAAMRDAILWLLAHPKEAARMGQAARARIERIGTLDAYRSLVVGCIRQDLDCLRLAGSPGTPGS